MMRAVRKIQAITRAVRAVPRREVVRVLVHLVPRRDWLIFRLIFRMGLSFRFRATGVNVATLPLAISSSLPCSLRRLWGILTQDGSCQSDLAFLGLRYGFLNPHSALDVVILRRFVGLNGFATCTSWGSTILGDVALVDLPRSYGRRFNVLPRIFCMGLGSLAMPSGECGRSAAALPWHRLSWCTSDGGYSVRGPSGVCRFGSDS